MSVLVDEQQDSLIVWLLESDWPEALARLVEQILNTPYIASGHTAHAMQSGLRAV